MPTNYADSLYTLLIGGDYNQFFIVLFNSYLPFGLFFWMVGLTFFVVIQTKTKNFTYAGAMVSIYFLIITSTGLVVNAYALMAMRYFGLVIGLVTGYYIYRMWRK